MPALAITFLALAPVQSHAALLSAEDLVTNCSGEGMVKATCDGYLMAVTDAFPRRESHGRGGGNVCIPPTVSIDQVRDAVLGFAKQGEARRSPGGVLLAARAMRAAWPCAAPLNDSNEAPKDK